jgi:co-chaperonin GroES (HSP10)
MKVLGNNILVTEAGREEQSSGGIILQNDLATGNKPAIVLATSGSILVAEAGIVPKQKVYLDWTKAFAVELEGVKCAVVDVEFVKLIISDD